ncbi:unnamed protein product [Lactuca virosa]|uniref:Uncharacterized protein n=1 Tax=Lactuca virosa TaxID=75947 RepID=A0AAU9NQH9_9ASTR|nr:unnamed protein product [Lactuca virosa]
MGRVKVHEEMMLCMTVHYRGCYDQSCEVQYPRLESPGFSAAPSQRQAPHARFSTLASSRLASQPGSVIAASSACEVQYPRLESPDFSARLRYSGKLRMRGSIPSPRVAWLLSPAPL